MHTQMTQSIEDYLKAIYAYLHGLTPIDKSQAK